jgi:hypothetical protein
VRKGTKEYDMEALLRYDGPKIEGLSFKVSCLSEKLMEAFDGRYLGSWTDFSDQFSRYRHRTS